MFGPRGTVTADGSFYSYTTTPNGNTKLCLRCNEPMTPFRAKWLADLVDKLMSILPEPLATEFGDQLIAGPCPDECVDIKDGVERIVLCGDCTLNAVNKAVTS